MRAPDFWQNPGASPWPILLAPLSAIWGLAAGIRHRRARPWAAGVPVISVGNAVAGGAGKTPTVLAVIDRLLARGLCPHVISRGYGGRMAGPIRVDGARHTAAEVGDEPLLLAARAPTWVARDRAAGARAAIAAGAGMLVLDDAHQNFALRKDLSLLVVDAVYGFGNGRVLPAGPLREAAPDAIARSDAIVLIGEGAPALPALQAQPVLRARLMPGVERLHLAGRKVVAFAGIGRPEKFFATLRGLGCTLVAAQPFGDHHAYNADEIMALAELAQHHGAVPVTTAKDAVRLPAEARSMIEVLTVTLEFADPAAFDRLLDRLLDRALAPGPGRG